METLLRSAMTRSVGRLLERLRTAQGWNHEEAAEALGWPRTRVTKNENGDRQVKLIEVPWYCLNYGVAEVEFMEEWLKERRREERLLAEFERRRLHF